MRLKHWYNSVPKNQHKQTKAGLQQRVVALSKKVREKSKNLSKRKGLRRAIDQTLTDASLMALIPSGSAVSAAYSRVKSASRSIKKSVASPCLKRWFDCVTDPFSQNAQGACIPAGANISSNRYMGYLRGDIYIGTAGVGFMALSPSPFNDVNSIWVSDATFTGTTSSIPLVSGVSLQVGVSGFQMTNNRFSANSILNSNNTQRDMPVQARIVGGGLRIYYTGTELNRSGLVSIYSNPQHMCAVYDAVTGLSSTGSLGTKQETALFPTTRTPYEYPLFPHTDEELGYYSFTNSGLGSSAALTHCAYPWSGGLQAFKGDGSTVLAGLTSGGVAILAGQPTTVVIVTGKPGETFHYEVAIHCEAVGDLTEGMRLPADSDPMGVDAMMAAMSRLYIERNSHVNYSSAALLRAEYNKVTMGRDMKVSL